MKRRLFFCGGVYVSNDKSSVVNIELSPYVDIVRNNMTSEKSFLLLLLLNRQVEKALKGFFILGIETI